jgi:hypothetical protein
MARFEVRPVASQTTPNSWSHTLILSDAGHFLDPTTQPVWIIALTLKSEDASEQGPKLFEAMSAAYQQIELKIPEALYQTVKIHLDKEENVSVAAICFTTTNATIIGKGNFKTHLWRGQKQATILVGNEREWSVVEGEWHEADRWWLTAGDSELFTENKFLEEEDIEKAAEALHGLIAVSSITSTANVLLSCNSGSKEEKQVLDLPKESFPLPEKPDPKIITKRRAMAIGWFVLILLSISIFFGAKARTEKLTSQNFNLLENQANQSIATASALKSIDQVKARSTLRELQTQVSQSKSMFVGDKKWITKWENLNTTVNTAYQEIAGEASLQELPEWFALSVVKSGFKGDQLVVSGDNLIILDKISTTVAKIAIDSKRAEIVTGGESIKGATYFTVDGNRTIVITDTGIKEVSLVRKTVATLIEQDADWKNVQAISLFNGNAYLLDTLAGEIWRYAGTTSGVGSKQKWFGQGVTLPSSDIVDMAVDGDVWILQNSGTIKRFRRGASLSFALSGLDIPLTTTTSFSVSRDQDIIAILDGVNQRIVRIDKEGVYQKQIKWNGLSEAQSIALSSDGNTIYILKNGSIYTATF